MKRPRINVVLLSVAALLVLLSLAARFLLLSPADKTKSMNVKVYVDNELYQTLSLPESGETRFRVDTEDGGWNIISLDSGGVYMLESNCPKQSCVQQGRVDAQNCESRALGHWILCLPHRVSVELVTDE